MIELGRLAPTLPVADMARALAFYEGVLGMRRTFENGDPVSFVILRRDAAELMLEVSAPFTPHPVNAAHILVSDARALHDQLVAAGARIVKPLRVAPYGLIEFVFADPDGHRIDIGQRT